MGENEWACLTCGEIHEKQFGSCWKCAGPNPNPGAVKAEAQPDPLRCPRCPTSLKFVGTKAFREPQGWLGDLGEMFSTRTRFDVYVCPRCGRVEFFVDGIGEEFRKQ